MRRWHRVHRLQHRNRGLLRHHLRRPAVVKAVSEGHRDFVRIVVAGRSDDYCVPCGECRQVLNEFAPNIEVICLNKAGEEMALPLKALLPYGFGHTYL